MKYIDVEKLLSEIERRKRQDTTMRERSILIDIETAIASLQQEQPEVDLEEEIKAEWDVIDTDLLRFEEFKAICYSCYELGLNARKEE